MSPIKEDNIIGISCYYHDSAASYIKNGQIICAVQEERFTRVKHDSSFPKESIKFILQSNNLTLKDIDFIVYYEKPLLTFERLLETYIASAPRGVRSFVTAMQVWLKEKLFLKQDLKKNLLKIQKSLNENESALIDLPTLLFSEHHLSHAASAFFPSPFHKSAILCMDGVGEWATTSAWIGKGNKIEQLWEISFPHSIGLLYSSFTYYCGFKVNSGEYKLMGLAPYGKPIYSKLIKEKLIDIKADGSFKLNMQYFKFHRGFRMTSIKFHRLFNQKPRKPESKLTQFHMDIAASIQKVTEEIVILLSKSIREETGIDKLCLAGGVALNCVSNGKLVKENIFEEIWVQPASGDAGTSLGAAYVANYMHLNKNRIVDPIDSMKGTYLGPAFSNISIINYLDSINASYHTFEDSLLFDKLAAFLSEGKIIGWFNGAMEFGPRSLGARSIIGDPRNKQMQSIMNLKIKYRESFRPFAPAILEEDASEHFDIDCKSPYMLIVAPVKKDIRINMSLEQDQLFGIDKINIPRSLIPAVTHIDYSARVQTVSAKTNPRFYNLINAFKEATGCPTLVNTSFNVRGEPIVCSPEDAFRCFMRTEMDILVLENQVLFKKEQKKIIDDKEWMTEFVLD